MKRLLIIGDTNSVYVHNYALQLRSHFGSSVTIDVFATFFPQRLRIAMPYDTIYEPYNGRYPGVPLWFNFRSNFLHNLNWKLSVVPRMKIKEHYARWSRPYTLWKFLREQKGNYDTVHVLYCIRDLMIMEKALREVAPRLIITVFGSDFFGLSGMFKRMFRKLYRSADTVTSNNSQALESIGAAFSIDPVRLKICRFGFNPLDTLLRMKDVPRESSRNALELPQDRLIVCIGYNYDSIQQHIPILESISAHPGIRAKAGDLSFLLPMTYGTEPDYKQQLLNALRKFPFDFKILDNFLSEEDNAHLRKSPDIFIQLQKSDSLSASTQEHLYGGNLLITGSWLPYNDLKNAGVYFRTISDIKDTGNELLICLEDLEAEKEKCKGNPVIVYSLSSWSSNLPAWLDLYD